jgi:hypothetical protein
LYDNARPHTAAHTLKPLKQLKREAMEHPAYSPDLAPADFHLLGPLKEALRRKRFSCNDYVKEAVHQWLRAQPNTFFSDGIKKLARRWEKYIANQGGYTKKRCNLLTKFLINRIKKIKCENFLKYLRILLSFDCITRADAIYKKNNPQDGIHLKVMVVTALQNSPAASSTSYTDVPPYPRVIRSNTYRGYVKPRIIPNAIHNVIFV